jgi:membrane protease YdiL (CAAX protease family)
MFAPGVSFLTLLPFLLLLAAVLGLWIHRMAWMSALAAAVLVGYFTGALQGAAAIWIGMAGLLALSYARAKASRGAAAQLATGASFFAFALVMGLELLPGMARIVVIDPVVLSDGALPYSLALGFPKVVGGIFILGLIHESRISSWRELGNVLRKTMPVFAITIAAVLACALALGYVRFDARWTPMFFAWALANLFFTCLSEEAFFRGFLQHELSRVGSNRESSRVIAWLFAAGLFGLVHLGGGWKFAVAATIAGLGYGWSYHRTQRVEAAMAVHFGLNASHFLLFTYPALA